MLLLDTQHVLWLANEPSKLSVRAAEDISDLRRRRQKPFISVLSFWEIALLHSKGRISLSVPLAEFMTHLEHSYVVLPLTSGIAMQAASFTRNFPKDPADRLIAATALHQAVPLVTSDVPIRQSGEVPCIW